MRALFGLLIVLGVAIAPTQASQEGDTRLDELLELPIPGSSAFNAITDGPPLTDIDPDQIEEVLPRDEPLSKYGNQSPYSVLGETYVILPTARGFKQSGLVSWYGRKFHGQRTSSGELFNMFSMTAAHRYLPIPTYVRVTRKDTGQSIIVKVNDRGPFHSDRVMDLSWAAAHKLGIDTMGTSEALIEALDPSELQPTLSASGRLHNAEKTTSEHTFFVQVASFNGLSAAAQLQSRLLQIVYAPVTITHSDDSRRTFHRVQVGPFANSDDAEHVSQLIRDAELGVPIILRR